MSQVSVVVVDDHQVVLLGVAAMFTRRHDIRVVGAAKDGEEALRVVAELRPDVVCVDYRMPDGGFDLIRRLRMAVPGTRVVLYTGAIEFQMAKHAVEAGATGVVSKDDRNQDLIQATLLAARGQPFVSPAFVAQAEHSEFRDLSPRQMTVLRHLAEGRGTREIAERMQLSEETIRHHVKILTQRLGASGRTHAVSIGLRNALIPIDSEHTPA